MPMRGKAAAPFEQITRDAVRALDRPGETRAGIAELTGLAVVRVRDYVLEEVGPGSSAHPVLVQRAVVTGDDGEPGRSGSRDPARLG